MPSTILGEHALVLPSGGTALRPASPAAGSTRYNTDTGTMEFFNGSTWIGTNMIPVVNSVTGTIYYTLSSTLSLSISNATETVTVRFSISGVNTDVANVAVSAGNASLTVPAAVYNSAAGTTVVVSVINIDGKPSSNSIIKSIQAMPSGGSITISGGYRYHTFTSSGSLTVPSGYSASAQYLVVAGGGSGGYLHGGGGGAGGYISSSTTISAGTYTITIGAGGASSNPNGIQGGSSSAFGVTAVGGGFGSGRDGGTTGGSGGSGGGGKGGNVQYAGGSGTAGQGNAGAAGNGAWAGAEGGGGGGGASSAGSVGTIAAGGNGGNGATWFDGVTRAGGGGGGSTTTNGAYPAGSGGSGGGGGGGAGVTNAIAGTANTGGGGGGSGYNPSGVGAAGAGGSGVVIVRYAVPS